MLCNCGCGNETEIAKRSDARRGHVKGEPMKYLPGHASNNGTARPTLDTAALSEPGAKEITERDIETLRTVDDLQAADIYDARARYLEKSHKRTFTEIGKITLEVERRELWSKIVDPETNLYFSGFDKWMMSAMPVSRATAYEAKRAVDILSSIPLADLQEMPRCNIKTLANLSSSMHREPEVIEAAKTLSEEEFIAKVEKDHPEQHVESKKRLTLKPEKSAKYKIDQALDAAMWAYGVETREEALEALVEAWQQTPCDVEGYTHLTNRLAFESSRQKAA